MDTLIAQTQPLRASCRAATWSAWADRGGRGPLLQRLSESAGLGRGAQTPADLCVGTLPLLHPTLQAQQPCLPAGGSPSQPSPAPAPQAALPSTTPGLQEPGEADPRAAGQLSRHIPSRAHGPRDSQEVRVSLKPLPSAAEMRGQSLGPPGRAPLENGVLDRTWCPGGKQSGPPDGDACMPETGRLVTSWHLSMSGGRHGTLSLAPSGRLLLRGQEVSAHKCPQCPSVATCAHECPSVPASAYLWLSVPIGDCLCPPMPTSVQGPHYMIHKHLRGTWSFVS